MKRSGSPRLARSTSCRNAESLCALCEGWTRLVFQHQSVGAQEEEYGHSVMSEERQQMNRQVDVGRFAITWQQPVGVVLEVLIFILLDDRT